MARKRKEHIAPKLQSLLIISDDSHLTAQMSSILAVKGQYLPVVDCPRMSRDDADNEVIRRTNMAARYQPRSVFLAAPSQEVKDTLKAAFPENMIDFIYSINDLKSIQTPLVSWPVGKFEWGKKDIGLGLLQAHRSGQEIVFIDKVTERLPVNPELAHMVVCEDGDDFAQVIAANYAYAVGAGMCVIPKVPDEEAEALCEAFYSSSAPGNTNQTERLQYLKGRLKKLSGEIPIKGKRLLTFITRKIPWGFAYPEMPTTHLISYPDMGIALLNGIVAEQPNSSGVTFGVLIDPGQVEASEIDRVRENLGRRGVLLNILRGPGANVFDVSRHVELLPYDFLLFSTHCGDADGWRWTYEYTDSEGIERTLVVNIAIGVGNIPDERDMLEVHSFVNFESLDGIDWRDEKAKENQYVGTAILDYIERSKNDDKFEPVKKEEIDRVPGSSVLKMWDHNYIPVEEQIAGGQLPVILNNACLSWHRLASTFIFSNARAYVGTLFEVLDSQAHEIAVSITGKYFGKPLAVALWRAQNDIYAGSEKRPYILVGPHFQRLRIARGDKAKIVYERMKKVCVNLGRSLKVAKTEYATKMTNEHLEYMKNQMESVYDLMKNLYQR